MPGCMHRHVVVHRSGREHEFGDKPESDCPCGPALMCPTCDVERLAKACIVIAIDEELVDQLRDSRHAGQTVH